MSKNSGSLEIPAYENTGLAILMGTTWLRLGYSQEDISARVTALFFSGAFLSFMAVAYIPAYIEDQATFFKERANGFYGPGSFLVANFLIGLPYLFIIVTCFSVIAYWMMGLWPTATGFWTFLGVPVPRSYGCRVLGHTHRIHRPQLHRIARPRRFRQRTLDGRQRLPGTRDNPERLLEVVGHQNQLSELDVPSDDVERIPPPNLRLLRQFLLVPFGRWRNDRRSTDIAVLRLRSG